MSGIVLPSFPPYFMLETTRLCNAKCVHCPNKGIEKTTPFLSDALFEKIAVELGRHSQEITQVAIFINGEPLLDKKLPERIQRLKELGVPRVIFSTNGSLLDETAARRVLEAGLDDLDITLNSMDAAKYEAIRVGLKHAVVVANIHNFLRLRDAIRPTCTVRVRTEAHPLLTKEDINTWLAYWRRHVGPNDSVYAKKMHNWGNQMPEAVESSRQTTTPCPILWSTFNISTSGDVGICCLDYRPNHLLGNVGENTIEEIWHGEAYATIREKHAFGHRDAVPMCRNCSIWDDDQKIF